MNKKKGFRLKGLIATAVVFALLLCGGLGLIERVSRTSVRGETETVRLAVRSAVLTCYAVEGAYPSDLDYLEEHYGLVYDRERYIISYDAFASNLMPDISVMEKGADR